MYQSTGGQPGPPTPYHQPQLPQYGEYQSPTQAFPPQNVAYSLNQQTFNPQHPQQSQQPYYGNYQPNHQAHQPTAYGTQLQSQQLHYAPPDYPPKQAYQPGSAGLPNSAQPSTQSCYNCGGPDHWAQNCPEPRRPVPFGSINNPRPAKRQKTGGPVITRYPPPPNRNGHPPLQRGFTHPPVGHQQFPSHNTPPTPVSANGQAHHYWQSQSTSNGSQASRQGSQQWSPQSIPTPTSSYGSQYASPVSMTSNGQQKQFFPSYPSQPNSQTSPIRQNSFGSVEHTLRQASDYFDSQNTISQSQGHLSTQQSISTEPTQSLEQGTEPVEPWLEELLCLDFSEPKPGTGPVVWHPPNPVALPLPSDYNEAEALGRLPIAASLPPGVPVSKYFRDLDQDVFQQNIKQKDEWPSTKNDPIFAEISLDCDAISLTELIQRRNDEALVLSDSDDEAEEHEPSESRTREEDFDNDRNSESDSEYESRSHKLDDSSDSTKQAGNETSKESDLAKEQEERLAALGVTGVPKPVQPSMRRSVATSDSARDDFTSPVEPSPRSNRSKSQETKLPYKEARSPPNLNSFDGHRRRAFHSNDSPNANGPGFRESSSNNSQDDLSRKQSDAREGGSRYRVHDRLPSPTSKKRRYFDGPSSLQHSPQDLHSSDFEAEHTASQSRKSSSSEHRPRKVMSPYRPRPDPKFSRKRSYRESSEESDGGPKRQEDEIAQRQRRSQPKVAAAYSRRW